MLVKINNNLLRAAVRRTDAPGHNGRHEPSCTAEGSGGRGGVVGGEVCVTAVMAQGRADWALPNSITWEWPPPTERTAPICLLRQFFGMK